MKQSPLKVSLTDFIRHIDSIRETLPMTSILFQAFAVTAVKDYQEFCKTNVETIDVDGKEMVVVKLGEGKIYEALESSMVVSGLAEKVLSSSLFVSLISQYDAFLNRLIRIIFSLKPEMLNGSDRVLTFSQLIDFNNMADAREYIIEKEIDTIMRKSHAEQFEYLEGKLNIKLRTNLPVWPEFIEITERRNLLVHCDGIVSNQYINVCALHNYKSINAKVGDQLDIKDEYFNRAYEILFEIATKLTHTIWRKFLPEDLANADSALNDICYNLVNSGTFDLADNLLEFAVTQKKHHDDESKSIFIINASLSKYLQNESNCAEKYLKLKDWSSSGYDFKLAVAILRENNVDALDLIRKIGSTGEIKQTQYQQWPLFTRFRELQEFKNLYKEIFEEEFKIIEIPKRPIVELNSKAQVIKKSKKAKASTPVILDK